MTGCLILIPHFNHYTTLSCLGMLVAETTGDMYLPQTTKLGDHGLVPRQVSALNLESGGGEWHSFCVAWQPHPQVFLDFLPLERALSLLPSNCQQKNLEHHSGSFHFVL